MGISAALSSGSKCYFFDGARYIRVTRGDEAPAPSTPAIRTSPSWGWPAGFGTRDRRRAVLRSKCYFFDGNRYIRVSRGDDRPRDRRRGLPPGHLRLGLAHRFGQSG